jgi:hypothetical protein
MLAVVIVIVACGRVITSFDMMMQPSQPMIQ